MKKQWKGFIIGFIFACLLAVPSTALADNIQAQFNTVNITVDGKSSIKQGENYQLLDGSAVPSSINYKGTTYIPIRKISELLGIGINYDDASKTVQVVTSSNSTKPQEDPVENTTTNSAVTTTTSYSVFNECTKANNNGQKVANVKGYKDGSYLNAYLDYSYYDTISAKMNFVQLWQTTVDSKGNITKINTISASKSGKVESSDSRNSVTLSSEKNDFENNVVMYQWTADNEYKVYSGRLNQDDYVNLYDTDNDKKYDVVILTSNGKAITPTDTNTNKDKEDNSKTDTTKENLAVASTGYSVINRCYRDINKAGKYIQYVHGFKDGTALKAITSDKDIVKGWDEPKWSDTGFRDAIVYKLSFDSNGVIVASETVSADVGQGKVEEVDKRNITMGGKTYKISDHAVFYQVEDFKDYSNTSSTIHKNDFVQLYDTDSSQDGYDIVIFSSPQK